MKRYWNHIVKSTEKKVEDFVTLQIKERQKSDFGRMPSHVIEGKLTIYLLADCLCVYFEESSKYFKDTMLLERVQWGLDFIENWQRADGSFDLPSCNFYSAPDTAFCFRRLYGAYVILKEYGSTDQEQQLYERYLKLLLRTIPIMLYGGFHTPNHRWAVMSALYTLTELVKEHGELALEEAQLEMIPSLEELPTSKEDLIALLKKRAKQYLSEGIDGDEDGEYAERSTGNYNAVVDKVLIAAYESTGDASYLGYVERNLSMMQYYVDGDDTIFTQNSTRQDQGKAMYLDQYFYLYVYMADKLGNEQFDRIAHKIIKDNIIRGDQAQDCMYIFMMYPRLKNYNFKGYGYLEKYRKYFPGSQVLRVKNNNYCCSVLNQKSSFLYVKFGETTVGVRIGVAYCDTRSFIPEQMHVTQDGCILEASASGWYYQPFAEQQDTTDWWKMDHKKRELLITSTLDITFTVKELEHGIECIVKSEGLQGLPLRVELDIPAECKISNESFSMLSKPGESMVLKNGLLEIQNDTTILTVGPGYGTHEFRGHYSGEQANTYGYSIFLNDYTPYERSFSILRKGD